MRGSPFVSASLGGNNAQIANLKRQLNSLKEELNTLKTVVRLNLERLAHATAMQAELRAYCQELEQKVSILQHANEIANLPFLWNHVANLGKPYPGENIPIFLAMAQCGEGIWSLFQEHLGFPCWRTIQRWRHEAFETLELTTEILDGSVGNVDRVFRRYFGENYRGERRRVVLAVDAASVSPKVVVHKDGTVEGLLDENASVSIDVAQKLRSSLTSLREFVNEVNEQIIKDFFVVFVCPLETESGGFPIMVRSKQNGAANQEFVAEFAGLTSVVCGCGVDVVGVAFDGDPGYLKFVRNLTSAFGTLNLSAPLSHQFVTAMPVFEDLLHLAKCIRYRFVCGSKICPYPHNVEVVSQEDFAKIGIVSWVLDPSQARKMDDFLPLMMFNCENLARALEKNMFNVCVALLPMSLALHAVMDSELTRRERLDYLSTAWAMFWCYRQAYSSSHRADIPQTAPRAKGNNEYMMIYDEITLDKGLALFFSLSRVIADARPVHLGALGTHWLEHFFGNIRRLCNKNDGPANFRRCLFITMMQKILFAKPKIPGSRKRLSDSGAILPLADQNECFPSFSLGGFLWEAAFALKLDLRRFPPCLQHFFAQASQHASRYRPGKEIIPALIGKPRPITSCGSTVACRMTDVSGMTTRKRDILASQISKI